MDGIFVSMPTSSQSEVQPLKTHLIKTKVSLNSRRKREFMPDEKKDAMYWEKRRKNNEAAKRSREKRRLNDFVVERKLFALNEENTYLRAELLSLKLRYGLITASAYTQQAQALQSSFSTYYIDEKSHSSDSLHQEWESSVMKDHHCLNRMKIPFLVSSDDSASSAFKEVSSPRKCFCPDTGLDSRNKQLDICCNVPPVLSQRQEPTYRSVYSSYLDYAYMDKYSFCYPSLYDTRLPISSNLVERETKSEKSTSDEEEEQKVPKISPVLSYNVARLSQEHARRHSALPHKLRIKAKALKSKEDHANDSDIEIIDQTTDDIIHHQRT
ncbi:nuclear factor interleukin-3-regulated protein-like [Protopterus annectens]|uniref:nuclear factor interleukin-3-regulated protein-like n=1 Tax=Protopterus annectens TaxID=7888 RepID=UPI001CF9C218|nr:nuclear factor interleukin-3-regulated protein-like [Protopterus annectens]